MEIKRSDSTPVFILSAGWRSGSTLLQRMCMEEYFMWGEAYGPAALIPHMCEGFAATTGWSPPRKKDFYDGIEKPTEILDEFVANLTPCYQKLVDAQIAWFEALFKQQEKWGLKEVRLNANHATYIRYLFPKAKIVFLYRNPYDSYRSIHYWLNGKKEPLGTFYPNKLYLRYPDQIITPANFGLHWANLTQGFLDNAKTLDAYLIRYEDLCAGQYADLEEYLGFKLSKKAWECRPYDGFGSPAIDIDVSFLESQVNPLATSLGYVKERMVKYG